MTTNQAAVLIAMATAFRRDALDCDRTAAGFEDEHSLCRHYAGKARQYRTSAVLLLMAAGAPV